MVDICKLHYPDLKKNLMDQCLDHFYVLRAITKLRKMPSTSELLDWIGVLLKSGVSLDELRKGVPFLGVPVSAESSRHNIQVWPQRPAVVVGWTELLEHLY